MNALILLFSSFFNLTWISQVIMEFENKIAIQNVEAWIGTEECADASSGRCIEKIPNAVILIKNGLIESVSESSYVGWQGTNSEGYVVKDGHGLIATIGFFDIGTSIGLPSISGSDIMDLESVHSHGHSHNHTASSVAGIQEERGFGKNNIDDLKFLENRLLNEEKQKPQNERNELSLIEKLNFVIENDFKIITYSEAFEILRNCKPNKKKKFKYLINDWGADLQSEHERYLVEKEFKCPVIIYNYPAKIKSFYMRLNDDGKTVRAMDILFPGIGEIVGGSQREERLDVLLEKIKEVGIDEKELWWYTDLRKFGSAVHSGFGLGFERLVMFVTGMSNIRDVIPFPRTPQNAEF